MDKTHLKNSCKIRWIKSIQKTKKIKEKNQRLQINSNLHRAKHLPKLINGVTIYSLNNITQEVKIKYQI
jgi:hypothetical protein